MVRTHSLRTDPELFKQIWSEVRKQDIRPNTVGYEKGEHVFFREWDEEKGGYTARCILAEITHIHQEYGLNPGFVCLSLNILDKQLDIDLEHVEAYYFGCYRESGHYLFDKNYEYIPKAKAPKDLAWPVNSLDGSLAPEGRQEQGKALIQYKGDWTAISFWDRSVDRRENSNSTFIARGTWSFNEMLEIAKKQFPEIMNRFTFQIVQKT